MDIGKAFTFVTEDESWIKKLLIGGVLTVIPIINLIPVGYGLRVLGNVKRGAERPLPEWDDWGGDFTKGLMLTLAALIYALPAIVLSTIAAVLSAVYTNYYGELGGVAAICFFGLQCLVWFWTIIVALWMPGAMIRYVATGRFGGFFQIAEIWALIAGNLGAYGMAILATIVAGFAAGLGMLLCVVGVIFTSFYSTLVGMHAYGQVAAAAMPLAPAEAPTLDEWSAPASEDVPTSDEESAPPF